MQLTVIKDNYSSLILDELELNNVDCNFFTKLPQYQKLNGPYTIYCNSSPRSQISRSSENLVFSDSYSNRENILFLGNTGMNAGKLVKDGTLFDRSLEVDINSSNNSQDYTIDATNLPNLPLDKYVFWSIDLKKISGDDIELGISLSFRLCNNFKIQSKNWTTFVGLGDTLGLTGTPNVGLLLASNGKTAKFRMACFQILAFDTLQELMEYGDSLQFRTKTEKMVSYSDVLPTSGNYNKGDIIYNTNPVSGGYVGWICTVSGTPGIWKGFGLIQI
jgi:hypothetical protein